MMIHFDTCSKYAQSCAPSGTVVLSHSPLPKRNTGTTDAFHQLFEDWPAREVALSLKLTTKHETSWSVRCYLTNIITNPESKSASARSFEGTWGEDKWRMPWRSFASLTRYCNEDSFQNGWWHLYNWNQKIEQTYHINHIGWWFTSTVRMDSKNGAIKLTKGLVEIETLQWFVKLDWNSALETSQLFMMKMRGNPVLLVSHLVPYLKRWNIWKSTRISLLTNFFMILKMMQFSNQLLKCLIHFTIFFWCCFLAHLELQWLGWIHGRMRRQPKKSRSTAIPHHGVHIVTRPTLRRDLKFKDQLLILDSV